VQARRRAEFAGEQERPLRVRPRMENPLGWRGRGDHDVQIGGRDTAFGPGRTLAARGRPKQPMRTDHGATPCARDAATAGAPRQGRGAERRPSAVVRSKTTRATGITRRPTSIRSTRVSRKPNSVGLLRGDHLSGAPVSGTPRCDRPWGDSGAGHTPPPLCGLAPGGVYRAGPVTGTAGALLPHRFTLARSAGPLAREPCPLAVCSLLHFP